MNELNIIQTKLKVPKCQKNKFGNYNFRSCEDILKALTPLLEETGTTLTITDEIKSVEHMPQMVITDESTKPKKKTLTLGTLSYVEATATLVKDDKVIAVGKAQAGIDINKAGMDISQCFGASSSYARKYALNGLFCIDDTKDADSTNDHGKAPSSESKPQSSDTPMEDSMKDAVKKMAKEKFTNPDEYQAWRVDNGLCEDLRKATEFEWADVYKALKEMK